MELLFESGLIHKDEVDESLDEAGKILAMIFSSSEKYGERNDEW